MLISSAELLRYSIPFTTPVALTSTTLHRREGALVRLVADKGLEGWGEVSPLPSFNPESLAAAIDQLRTLIPQLVGRRISPNDLLQDNHPFYPTLDLLPSTRFGLEAALLNLSAVSCGMLLPEMLSDRSRETVEISGLLSGSERDVLSRAASMREQGYRAVKLKVGRRRVAEDAEIVWRVQEILGNGVRLRLDANRAWSFKEAEEFAGRVSGIAIEYVEEPLSEPGGLPGLARRWDLPVALDESLVGMDPDGLEEYPHARAVVLKPTLLGGVVRSLRFIERARALGMMPVVSASYEAGVGTSVLVALAATGDEPAGLDTYRGLAEDVLQRPLALPAPAVEVRGTMEAARRVEVGRLEPVFFG